MKFSVCARRWKLVIEWFIENYLTDSFVILVSRFKKEKNIFINKTANLDTNT